MDVTNECIISGKFGFDLISSNRFAIVEVEAKNGDLIKVNKINGIRYKEIWGAYENPLHEDRPIVDNENIVVVIGGNEKRSKRIISIIGK